MGTVADALGEAARRRPDAPATVLPDGRRVSFRDLDADAGRVARGLAAVGVGPGTRAALAVPPGPDFFPLVYGLLRAGAVPVVVDPGMGMKEARRCLEEAEPEAFVGTGKALLARALLGLGGGSVRTRITVGTRLGWGGLNLEEVRRAGDGPDTPLPPTPAPEDPAAILFTSGSTGPAKGVVYTHGNLAAQLGMVREAVGAEEGEVDCPTFALFALFDPALGMTAAIPDMDFARPGAADPESLARTLIDRGATGMFASPGLLEPLSRWAAANGVVFPRLRRVVSAGAPVPARVVERMAGLLAPGARIHTPYGATEALPVTNLDHREILGETAARTAAGEGVCVGRPVEGAEVRVLPIADGPLERWRGDLALPGGAVGEIVVRGPQVTRGYWRRPDADALAKVPDPAGGGFFHRMGDLGRLDDRGRLWYLGRKSERVRTAEGDLFTAAVEGVFDAHPAVFRTALVGVGGPGRQRPVLCVDGEPDEALRQDLLALGARHEASRRVGTVLFHPGFPVDARHNAKIRRAELAAWAAERVDA